MSCRRRAGPVADRPLSFDWTGIAHYCFGMLLLKFLIGMVAAGGLCKAADHYAGYPWSLWVFAVGFIGTLWWVARSRPAATSPPP